MAVRRPAVSAIQLLQLLKPTRKILGVVSLKVQNQWHVGTALSDPYLSHASALPPFLPWSSTSSFATPPVDALIALAKAECADAVVLGLPVEGQDDPDAVARRDALLHHLVQSPHTPAIIVSVSDAPPATTSHVVEEFAKNILWDSLQVPNLQLLQHPTAVSVAPATDQACLHAGISLQMWLDKHCGGWANTFG